MPLGVFPTGIRTLTAEVGFGAADPNRAFLLKNARSFYVQTLDLKAWKLDKSAWIRCGSAEDTGPMTVYVRI